MTLAETTCDGTAGIYPILGSFRQEIKHEAGQEIALGVRSPYRICPPRR
jgi:hypothetical protein